MYFFSTCPWIAHKPNFVLTTNDHRNRVPRMIIYSVEVQNLKYLEFTAILILKSSDPIWFNLIQSDSIWSNLIQSDAKLYQKGTLKLKSIVAHESNNGNKLTKWIVGMFRRASQSTDKGRECGSTYYSSTFGY